MKFAWPKASFACRAKYRARLLSQARKFESGTEWMNDLPRLRRWLYLDRLAAAGWALELPRFWTWPFDRRYSVVDEDELTDNPKISFKAADRAIADRLAPVAGL